MSYPPGLPQNMGDQIKRYDTVAPWVGAPWFVNLARSSDSCEGWQPSDPGWGGVQGWQLLGYWCVKAVKTDLNYAHLSTFAKYDTPAVCGWWQVNWPSSVLSGAVQFGGLMFNWWGVMSQWSASLCQHLGITKRCMKLMCCSVAECGEDCSV